MKYLAILVAAIGWIGQPVHASTITQGSVQYRYEIVDSYDTVSLTITLIGEGLNVALSIGGPSTPLFPSQQPFCGVSGPCGAYSLGGNLQTGINHYSGMTLPSATVGGVTYNNVFARVSATIQGPSNWTGNTTCSQVSLMMTNCGTSWGPFPFSISGVVTLEILDLQNQPFGPRVLAQDSFQGTGFGTATTTSSLHWERRNTTLMFTPEQSPIAYLSLAAIAAAGMRRWAKSPSA